MHFTKIKLHYNAYLYLGLHPCCRPPLRVCVLEGRPCHRAASTNSQAGPRHPHPRSMYRVMYTCMMTSLCVGVSVALPDGFFFLFFFFFFSFFHCDHWGAVGRRNENSPLCPACALRLPTTCSTPGAGLGGGVRVSLCDIVHAHIGHQALCGLGWGGKHHRSPRLTAVRRCAQPRPRAINSTTTLPTPWPRFDCRRVTSPRYIQCWPNG